MRGSGILDVQVAEISLDQYKNKIFTSVQYDFQILKCRYQYVKNPGSIRIEFSSICIPFFWKKLQKTNGI